jgi:hypothetical protein
MKNIKPLKKRSNPKLASLACALFLQVQNHVMVLKESPAILTKKVIAIFWVSSAPPVPACPKMSSPKPEKLS